MYKKVVVTVAFVVFFAAVPVGLYLGLETVRPGSTLAEEAKKCACKYGCSCEHCRGKLLECPCGKETKSKCKKCGHVKCPDNCNRCPDCVIERSKEKSGY